MLPSSLQPHVLDANVQQRVFFHSILSPERSRHYHMIAPWFLVPLRRGVTSVSGGSIPSILSGETDILPDPGAL